MKRFHVHVAVENVAQSLGFYSALFGCEPAVVKDDYAKWMLDDPRVNFAISARGAAVGVDHLGIQVDSDEELAALERQLAAADVAMLTQTGTACCYAESDKHWVSDPAGIAWETYHTLSSVPTFNGGEAATGGGACCAPPVKLEMKPRIRLGECAPGSGCC
ncbi:ArsI/CadI family heavy metal resistance metalloenzyme [Crenobacter cavernae]|uniref:Glyoxalase/bleomycin resistance/dioxygenase family protein n=1 Tax=Crenobacter cavernae TaxID=2290923 RepID=A0ABY0FEV1_9NEIS|nr:ArsI/CadI family heavy metal resistance metalloenzyme [Crenobacter cavernae]RXZ44838.1 glyoxalase/bleomycin resistance/dioxygenase family protein [Crenobacter cavernae]